MEILAPESGGILDLTGQFSKRYIHREWQQQHSKIETQKETRQGGVQLRKIPDTHTWIHLHRCVSTSPQTCTWPMSMDFDYEENNKILTLLNLWNEHILGIMQTSLVIQWFIFAFYIYTFILCMVWRNVFYRTGAEVRGQTWWSLSSPVSCGALYKGSLHIRVWQQGPFPAEPPHQP